MSTEFSVGGVPLLVLDLVHGETGAWSGRAQLATGDPVQGAVDVVLPGLTLRGYATGGVFSERAYVLLQGGAGGLSREVPGQHYQVADGRTVAGGLLTQVGEQLDPASDAAVLATALVHYQHVRSSCGLGLSRLCRAIGATWWTTPQGLVRIGNHTYPAAAPEGLLVLDEQPDERVLMAAPETAPPLPGTTVEGKRITAVHHRIEGARWRVSMRYAA